MARLDTQINQIYLLPPEAKQTFLVLTDEVLGNNSHLFVLADLVKAAKKTEGNELNKISEIIVNTFREAKKLSGETLFEAALSTINQQLADLAHDGKKSWIGKSSALIVLKASDNIFLANSGQMTAMLYRNGEFLEILNPEKRGLHPLKTFSNFTSGKLKDSDVILLTTSNLFSYVALENLTKLMNKSEAAEKVVDEVSKILKDTANSEDGFASFFVTAAKPAHVPAAAMDSPKPAAKTEISKPEPMQPEPAITEPVPEEEIYAPLPGKLRPMPSKLPTAQKANVAAAAEAAAGQTAAATKRKLPKISLPKLHIPFPKFEFLSHLSGWAKFFLVSFIIFLILFASNIVAYTMRKHKKQTVDQTQTTLNTLIQDMNDTESALIYRNQTDAVRLLAQVKTDLANLKNINGSAYDQYAPKVTDLANRVNHITVVANPALVTALKHPATYIAPAGKGFFAADSETGTITTFNTTKDDTAGKDLFLLNKIGNIQGLVFIPNVGGVVTTASEMYLVNTSQNQFDLLHIYPKTNFSQLHFVNPDRLYTLDTANNKVLRIQFSKTDQIAPTSLLKGTVSLADVKDLGTDTNVYLLSSTDLVRYFNGNLDSNFKLIQPTDEITSANKLFVANNIYIVESAKKRVLIYNKQGALLTQVFFPNATDLRDIYVDESARNIFLLDSNKIESITF